MNKEKPRGNARVTHDKFNKRRNHTRNDPRGEQQPMKGLHQHTRQQRHSNDENEHINNKSDAYRQPKGKAVREEYDLNNVMRTTLRHFVTLRCEFTLSLKAVKSAYSNRALTVHPDKGGHPEEFKCLGVHLERPKATIAVATYQQKDPARKVE